MDMVESIGTASDRVLNTLMAGLEIEFGRGALLKWADGHPLTLRIIAALLRHIGSARDVLRKLSEQGASGIVMPGRKNQSATTSLRMSLSVAFSALDRDQRHALWMVALSPGGLMRDLHLSRAGSERDAVSMAASLEAWNLIEVLRDPAFPSGHPAVTVMTMLAPVRAFVLEELANEAPAIREPREIEFAASVAMLISRLQNGFIQGGALNEGLVLMRRELPNALAMFEFSLQRFAGGGDTEFLAVASGLAGSTMMTLFTSGRFALGIDVMRKAATAEARAGRVEDALHSLLQMQVLAEREGSVEAAAEALVIAEQLAGDRAGEPRALLRMMQSSSQERLGNYVEAAKTAREALSLFDELAHETYFSGFAAFQLGRALEFSHRPGEALPYLERALRTWRRERDPINSGSTLHHLGNCRAYLGQFPAALAAYIEAGEQFAALCAVDYISNALGEAGLIIPDLHDLAGLPPRALVEKGLHDVVGRIVKHAGQPRISFDRLLVDFRKLSGLVSLTLHTGNADLLAGAADLFQETIVEPSAALDPRDLPDCVVVWRWHIDPLVEFLRMMRNAKVCDTPENLIEQVAPLAVGAFPEVLHADLARWLASYISCVLGHDGISSEHVRAAFDEYNW